MNRLFLFQTSPGQPPAKEGSSSHHATTAKPASRKVRQLNRNTEKRTCIGNYVIHTITSKRGMRLIITLLFHRLSPCPLSLLNWVSKEANHIYIQLNSVNIM